MINPKISLEILLWKKDASGRIIGLLIKTDNVKLNLVNIYLPTVLPEKKAFYENLHEYFLPANALIIGGDFNCTESALDKFGGPQVRYISFLILSLIFVLLTFGAADTLGITLFLLQC